MTQEQQEQFFIDNKYLKKYLAIIEDSKNRPRPEKYERHHIIPKSFGGSDSEDNYAYLTLREHFLVHLILVKIAKGQYYKHKMAHALNRMTNSKKGKYKITSRMYETARIEHSEAMSGKGNHMWGKTGEKCHMFGKTPSEETKQKMSKANTTHGRSVGATKDPKIKAAAHKVWRDNRTPEEKKEYRIKERDRKRVERANMTPEELEDHRRKDRENYAKRRDKEK